MALTALIWKIAIFISMCKIVHLLSNESSANRREQHPCVDGWLQYDHYCYRALRIFITWEEAASTCSSFGGNLASVHSIEQHDFLNHILRQGRMNMWIGLHDRETDRNHVWEDGSDVDFTKWGPGQPTGYYASREDCVEMRYRPNRGATGDWNDEACSSKRAFICQSQTVNATGKMEYDTSIQTVSITDKMVYDTSIQASNTTDKMEYDTSIQTVNTIDGMECNKSITISLTNFVIALILTAILCALFGQLIYCKRQWLQDKKTNLAAVLFRSSKKKLSNNGSTGNIISDWNQEGDRMQMYGVLKQ